ncbi:tetraacyldisaccharide 4'-kinase [Pleionea litopenaei]|uniref:Tetraacyldisaccharide 4'-kinase n=1 Tax=Pleionea litopenaei TaxID=3070815 RepID=A0AA51X7B6_9GAMM|nr:tetraacyldisaccharide 4'-kinase [Pleionea sp. HL-JVS1]WMS88043.1 tetraacyldisaccharide 4'-kinase [Pleionea sp. HL-JVS1]
MTKHADSFWYRKSLWRYLLLPIHWLLILLVKIRRVAYQREWIKSYQSKTPIWVIGNISVGGTGKTPFLIWLVDYLKQKGLSVGVVTRGYGGSSENYPLLVESSTSPDVCGDEPKLISARSQCPVVVDPIRSRAVSWIEKNLAVDVILSDDGLQHYAMNRQLEFCLVDGYRMFGNELLMPLGPLREPVNRLNACDLVIQNSGEQQFDCYFTLHADALVNVQNEDVIQLTSRESWPFDEYDAVCGIGNPEKFRVTLSQFSQPDRLVTFSDHHAFKPEDLLPLDQKPLVMTEKDAIKCRAFAKNHWWYLRITPVINLELVSRIDQVIKDCFNR